jgi:hypothetical protein
MADFPALIPSARNFQLGQFPVKTYRAMSGATLRRSFGNRPFGHTLELEFRNVPESTLTAIIDHYTAQAGGTIGFRLKPIVFAGYTSAVVNRVANPLGIEWLYASPPTVQSVLKDRSTVIVNLVGEIR